MDFLRSAYDARMKTIIGGTAVDVRWFRTAPGTPMFKGPTVFRSRNWCEPHDNDGIGEQYDPDVCCGTEGDRWVSGKIPAGFIAGPHPCGTDAVAATGAGPGDETFMTEANGAAPCCIPPPTFFNQLSWFLPFFGGEPQTYGPFPPAGVTVTWSDTDGHSGAFTSGGASSGVPFGYYGAASYGLVFNMAATPPVVFQTWPVSVTSEAKIAWGVGYLRFATFLATQPPFVTTYTW